MNANSGGRRRFFRTCFTAAGLVMANPRLLAETGSSFKQYTRVRLTGHDGTPVNSADLESRECYVFNYPFVTTPCFLINLGQRTNGHSRLDTGTGSSYVWPGGVGPDSAIVSFAAICAHKLSYPTRAISFINFRPDQKLGKDTVEGKKSSQPVIFCCSENSVYDPLHGAKVLGGPAPQPLATIVLEYDKVHDHYYALGTLGPEQYDKFFEQFGYSLALENQVDEITTPVTRSAIVYHHAEYSRQIKSC